ncbi:hypothetical protein MATL_G00171550 [Megalops atlanticus]|uniref:Peroxisome proliferator-activated receptor gamma coactivator 1-beta n=1 Tax=Megalops atlanticus TaxID=7932 RepID=A0A9D3T0R3_MEGAT|nr:hypothetical protein MATL_G00171550 [Megalops atlanticus]
MADCASLLDEELSSFVFSYLTENSGSQYGEEEVSSDRLDADFPDIDLSQLDASDFDSVNCLSELHWCNDQSDTSPASIQYSTGDPELFEIEEENAALLAALTDSLDGMVEDEVGGLSVFPSLGEGPEEEEDLPLENEPFPGSLSAETEDPSLLKKLLMSPPNVPVGIETHKEGGVQRHSNRSQHLKPLRPLVKSDSTQERKPRAVRPAGRLCTELHRHLTTTQEAEDTPSGDTEDESESEEEDEEEEEDESGSEDESSVATELSEPSEPQFSSEKELRSVVELIKYMHTYCLPARKQSSWDRKERECPGFARRARPDVQAPRPAPVCHKASPPVNSAARPRAAFVRRREVKGHSLLRELLETVSSFDVSKPYRLHSPPYSHSRGAPAQDRKAEPLGKTELKDSACKSPREERTPGSASETDGPRLAKEPELGETSFSVRRSRRLASFPGRFAKKARLGRLRSEPISRRDSEEAEAVKQCPAEETSHSSTSCKTDAQKTPVIDSPCIQNEKRACLCLPLTPKSTGDTQFANKAFEQTLSVELCGTAGLTPPTTPPHKPAEEELFKPEGKGESPPKGSWLSRAHVRKLPEQTELYAQLRRMGQAGEGEPEPKGAAHRAFGDHDYCLQGLGESRKRPAPGGGEGGNKAEREGEESGVQSQTGEQKLFSKVPGYLCKPGSKVEEHRTASPRSGSPQALSPRNTEEGTERSPAPNHHAPCTSCCQPQSPSDKQNFSCENSGNCHGDKQRNKANEDCRVFYIHNLPCGITQAMLCRRFEAYGEPEDCKIIIKDNERCGVVTFLRPPGGQGQRRRRDAPVENGGSNLRRFCRKRYIDLDEAGPGPVKSKYDAMDFDTLLKEAQKSLHR